MRETVNGHFLFWLKKAPVRAGGSSLLPPESPRGFSSLARMQAINILNYFTGPPQQWEDVFILSSYTGVLRFFFSKTNHALIGV